MDFNGEAFHFEKDGKCSLAAGSSGCRCANDVMVPHQHAECRGHAAQASAYYPPAMCRAVVKAFEHAWSSDINSLEKMTERLLLKYEDEDHSTSSRTLTSSSPLTTASPTTCCGGDGGEPMVLALSTEEAFLGSCANWEEAGGDQANHAEDSSSCRSHWHEQLGAAPASKRCSRMGPGDCPEPSMP